MAACTTQHGRYVRDDHGVPTDAVQGRGRRLPGPGPAPLGGVPVVVPGCPGSAHAHRLGILRAGLAHEIEGDPP